MIVKKTWLPHGLAQSSARAPEGPQRPVRPGGYYRASSHSRWKLGVAPWREQPSTYGVGHAAPNRSGRACLEQARGAQQLPKLPSIFVSRSVLSARHRTLQYRTQHTGRMCAEEEQRSHPTSAPRAIQRSSRPSSASTPPQHSCSALEFWTERLPDSHSPELARSAGVRGRCLRPDQAP